MDRQMALRTSLWIGALFVPNWRAIINRYNHLRFGYALALLAARRWRNA
jgi:hypothetical protein